MSLLPPRVALLLALSLAPAVLAAAPAPPAPSNPMAPPRLLAAPRENRLPLPKSEKTATPVPFDEALTQLRKAGKVATAQRLLNAANAAKAEKQKRGKGQVVAGRAVIAGGAGKLDQLLAPGTSLEDGWFVTLLEDSKQLLQLRLHGYEAVGISPLEFPQKDVIHVGAISLHPLPPEKAGAVKGRVVATDPKVPLQVYAFIIPGEVTTALSKGEPARPGARVEVKLQKDGSFLLGGLTPRPARYELWFKAPGHEPQSQALTVAAGTTQDVGEIRLAKPSRLRVRYVLSSTPPPFQNAQVRESQLSEGQSFKADPAMKGDTFFLQPRPGGSRLKFATQPTRLASLGQGKLEDYVTVDPANVTFAVPYEFPFEPGRVYLVDHSAAEKWVLFQVEAGSPAAK
ncbi:hypothetical protein POL68_26150 [Stigmatella sp. ncwal1]|uniref:PEGA domain-containing protein n=1 Tax=Stigmatella ashevillensis TaxID=2995309 RepID=A0ABT5DI14_9BACT|nr:hypothetical protein [Stigmatella ashevillena]MDC0711977.1 hypothetical protein [Stigmatella ashevillena]